jgi:hypothetical protein
MMIVLDRLLDRIGDVNPQLFRELKERLTLRNIGIVSAIALLIQSLIFLYFNTQLPPAPSYDLTYARAYGVPKKLVDNFNQYCVGNFIEGGSITPHLSSSDPCTVDSAGNFIINWAKWWSGICYNSGWIVFAVLILGSVYMLVADLINEEKRGTMSFIRLSPRSPRQIFIGKILGVPVLVYLAVAWMIPLHLLAGIKAGASLGMIASWYIAIGSVWFLLSSTAILYVLLGGGQAILTTLAVATPIGLFFKDSYQHFNFKPGFSFDKGWFGLPLLKNSALTYIFESTVFVIVSYLVWQSLERRYLNPNTTAINKSQSYLINIALQILVLGFAVPFQSSLSSNEVLNCAYFVAIDFTLLLLSIPLLLPSKQTLQDWSRYRRERRNTQQRKFWQRELVQDLLFNDKSPALLSIAINLGMVLLIWIPISLFLTVKFGVDGWRFLGCVCLGASLVLIYAAIAHLVLFLNVKKHNLWTMGIIAVIVTLPIGVALIMSSGRSPTGLAAFIILFSPFAPAGVFGLSGEIIFAAFTTQLAMLAVLTRQLQRKLQISGQSHSKELLARS